MAPTTHSQRLPSRLGRAKLDRGCGARRTDLIAKPEEGDGAPDPIGGSSDAAIPNAALPNTGLGRGLSGILGDFAGHAPAEEVSALLGSSTRRNSPQVRRIVAELAVDTMSSGFAADGVLMARLGADGEVDPLQTRLAGAWAPSDPLGFEVNGRLWNCLTERTSVQGQVPIGRLHVLFARHKIGAVVIATAVVRARAFSATEQQQLASLIRSAARATEVEAAMPERVRVRSLPAPGGAVSATVELFDGTKPAGRGVAPTSELAVARATIDLFGLDLDVRFAGSTRVDGDDTTIVVLHGQQGTVFGLAVTAPDSSNGAVEATFSAAVSAGIDPLGGPVLA